MADRRVVITGLGAVMPLGLTVSDYWQGLVDGRCGIGQITLFDASSYPVKVAAEVKDFDPLDYMEGKRADRTGRCTQFAIGASKMALESARLSMSAGTLEKAGVVLATTGMTSTIADLGETLKTRGPRRIDPLFVSKTAASMVTAQVGLELGARGPNTSVNSACASGNDALGIASNHIRLGHAEIIISGGAEATISPAAIASTGRVGALSTEPDPAKASRPFDLHRNGFVFGEGAGVLVLESYEHARKRDAPILAELAGTGWSFDAYSETAPDARQQAVAMTMALRDSGTSPGDVDYINAHGTSTKLNDAAETAAIKAVFGEKAKRIPISSNKSMIGHLACAAGAVESVAAVMTINSGIIPPTINYHTPDPDCDLDYVPNEARRQPVNICLCNSFGMGGQNCCLVMRRLE